MLIGSGGGERAERCRATGIWQVVATALAPLASGGRDDDRPTGFWRVLVQVDRIRFATRADDFDGLNGGEAFKDIAGLLSPVAVRLTVVRVLNCGFWSEDECHIFVGVIW